jgi:hypothetical protein
MLGSSRDASLTIDCPDVGSRHLPDGEAEFGCPHPQPMVNPECKLLLLAHAFDVLGVQRVSFVTDVLNKHSQAAIAKLRATREGMLRSHMVSQGGRMRDSVVFSIVAGEWSHIRQGLETRTGES